LQALDRVDLVIGAGQALGLVGESACGKTTLARCAALLLEPSSGCIYFDNDNLLQLPAAELRRRRREFQMIFQDPLGSMNPRMPVGEILSEPFVVHGLGTRNEREKWVRDLLATAALDDTVIERRPALLSGGQQQRVGIARALALQPRFLIADEPVSALDASIQAQILNLIADLRKRFGLTLMIISHSLAVVRYLCTQVAVMYRGRIVEEAPVDEFFGQPEHPYSRLLLHCMPGPQVVPEEETSPKGEASSGIQQSHGCAFQPRCREALPRCEWEVPRLTARAQNAKVACFLYE
jgi:oligopeptide/dipeptide ABC transporter ATP-binding protein